MTRISGSTLLGGALAIATAGAQAATLVLDPGGVLLGADQVLVNGQLYDVRFLEGTCNTGSPACVLTFTDSASAVAASQALLDQVFVGIYDSLPARTYGITNTAYGYAMTPYKASRGHVFTQAARNDAGGPDAVVPITVDVNVQPLFSYNSGGDGRSVFAAWTPSPTPVPLPGAALLFASALAGLGFEGVRRGRTG